MVGHSPKALKRIFLWLLHEVGMPRSELCKYLVKNKINANKVLLSAWSGYGNRPKWSVWKDIYTALNKLLSKYGLAIEDFVYEDTYTPMNLTSLRKKSGLKLDDFARLAGEKPQRILLYESDSKENTRGLGYANFHDLKMAALGLRLRQELSDSLGFR